MKGSDILTISEWQQKFSNNLCELMRTNNMTQYRLSKESGVSSGRLSEYINMRSLPNIFAIINIAYVFDVSIESLIDFGERIEQRRE